MLGAAWDAQLPTVPSLKGGKAGSRKTFSPGLRSRPCGSPLPSLCPGTDKGHLGVWAGPLCQLPHSWSHPAPWPGPPSLTDAFAALWWPCGDLPGTLRLLGAASPWFSRLVRGILWSPHLGVGPGMCLYKLLPVAVKNRGHFLGGGDPNPNQPQLFALGRNDHLSGWGFSSSPPPRSHSLASTGCDDSATRLPGRVPLDKPLNLSESPWVQGLFGKKPSPVFFVLHGWVRPGQPSCIRSHGS